MDDKRFDDVTRSLSEGTSRRRVVGGVLGGMLGALGLGAAAAEAAKKKKKDKKDKKVKCCHNGQTKTVSKEQWNALKLQGASKGKCPVVNPTSTTTQDPKKQCQKLHAPCGSGRPRCCEFDPHTGYALVCDESKKNKVCVRDPNGGTSTTSTTAGPTTTTAGPTTTTAGPTTTTLPPTTTTLPPTTTTLPPTTTTLPPG